MAVPIMILVIAVLVVRAVIIVALSDAFKYEHAQQLVALESMS